MAATLHFSFQESSQHDSIPRIQYSFSSSLAVQPSFTTRGIRLLGVHSTVERWTRDRAKEGREGRRILWFIKKILVLGTLSSFLSGTMRVANTKIMSMPGSAHTMHSKFSVVSLFPFLFSFCSFYLPLLLDANLFFGTYHLSATP